jgi:hypothetical protein
MLHTVQPGETLWSIARRYYGDGLRWRDIVRANGNGRPDDLLLVGETLVIHDGGVCRMPQAAALGESPGFSGPPRAAGLTRSSSDVGRAMNPPLVPAASYVFVLADEINPLTRKVIRRVIVNPRMAAEVSRELGRTVQVFAHPERWGFTPSDPSSKLPPGRHVMGMKPSPYVSASDAWLGATRFKGAPFWIDATAARAAGATIPETSEIVADLDRIAAKTATPTDLAKVLEVRGKVIADREVLVKGAVPASAVKGAGAMAATRVLQGVQIIGFTMSAINLAHATEQSMKTGSARPIAAEAVRQAGGWAAAWAGMKLGAAGGALVGIQTGPGAVVTGAIGGVVGGVAGYFGFDWIADHISEN